MWQMNKGSPYYRFFVNREKRYRGVLWHPMFRGRALGKVFNRARDAVEYAQLVVRRYATFVAYCETHPLESTPPKESV